MNILPKEIREKIESESRFTKDNREKKALVSLGGFAITESGKITRSDYFRFLNYNLDDYEGFFLEPKEAEKFHNYLLKLKTGTSSTVPMVCKGDKCPFAAQCPLVEIGKAPLLKRCPIEVNLLNSKVQEYMEEYDVDPDNYTEVGYCNELAEIEIFLHRLNWSLAKSENATLITKQPVTITNEGVPILQEQISPYMEQREKLLNRKSRVIKLMVGDRQEIYKKQAALKERDTGDLSTKQANMMRQIQNLQTSLDDIEKQFKDDDERNNPLPDVVTPQDLIDELDD